MAGPLAAHAFLLLLLVFFRQESVGATRTSKKFTEQNHDFTVPGQNDCINPTTGQAVLCKPALVNSAFEKKVSASSTCGKTPEDFCIPYVNEHGREERKCSTCDAKRSSSAHPAALITDLHNPNNQTCWVSEPFSGSSKNVSLTLSFRKAYEINYVTIQFCHQIPDSLAFYKSVDFGKTWQPFQFYSTDCYRIYGIFPNQTLTKENEHTPLCAPLPKPQFYGARNGLRQGSFRRSDDFMSKNALRLVFATTVERPSAADFDNTPVLQEWSTATDIRVQFRHLYSPNSVLYSQREKSVYSVSDLSIVGRCKCNGHASQCRINDRGEPECVCQHNTDGKDCEKCKPFHYDKPWHRATPQNAHVCKACECNSHATSCQFSASQYEKTGRKSGGVCNRCQYSTTGPQCDECVKNFFRDTDFPISDSKACQACDCHPVGSRGKDCNKITGQCDCKDGVVERQCTRCAEGYSQSQTAAMPCIKIPTTVMKRRPRKYRPQSGCPEKCRSRKRFLTTERFCRKQLAFQAHVQERSSYGDFVRFRVRVNANYKEQRLDRGIQFLWVKKQHLKCRCPKFHLNRDYLVLSRINRPPRGFPGYLLNNRSIVIPWRNDWTRRLKKMRQREHHCSSYVRFMKG